MTRALAIKSSTDTALTLEGWGVVFGGEDLTDEYFSADTDFWLDALGPVKMTLYDHGQDGAIKSTVMGSGTLERKSADGLEGLWFTAQLDKSVAYLKQVEKLAKAGVLGASSGAISHLVEREAQNGKTWLKSWPIAEMSLTVTPCEPRTLGYETLKSTVIRAEAMKAGRKVHQVKALSFEELRSRLSELVNPSSPFVYEPDWTYIVETYPDYVIACREDVDNDGDGGYWRFTYTVAEDGTVTLGEAQQVEQTYVPVTKTLVAHAEALKARPAQETPAEGDSGEGNATQPTSKRMPEIHVSEPIQEPSMPLTAEEMTSIIDGVAAKNAPQFDQIAKILERFESEPALKSAGHVSVDGGAADKNVKTFADWLVAVKRNDTKRLETVYATKAALAEEDGTTGGYLVPTEFRAQLLQVASESGVVRSRATILPMGAREMEVPALDQQTAPTAGTTAFFGGAQAYWTAEAGAYTETEPKFKMVRLNAQKLAGYTLSSNEMLADSALALEMLLRTLFGNAIAWYEDYAFLRGDGAGKPLGVQNAPCTISVARTAGGNDFEVADIGPMLKRMLPSSVSRAVWVMHPFLIPSLIGLATSNPNVSFVGNLRDSLGATLMGLPIIFSEKMATSGSAFDVLLADFSYYLIGDRQSINIAASEHYKFVNGQQTWRFDERVDGQPWLKSAITLSDAASTISPFVYLS